MCQRMEGILPLYNTWMRRGTSPCRGEEGRSYTQLSMLVKLCHTRSLECELGLHLTHYLDTRRAKEDYVTLMSYSGTSCRTRTRHWIGSWTARAVNVVAADAFIVSSSLKWRRSQVRCRATSKTLLNGWLLGVAQPQSQQTFSSVSSCIPSMFEQGSSSLAIFKRGRDNMVLSLRAFEPASCPAGRFRRSFGSRRSCASRLDEDVARRLRTNVNLVPGCML